MEVNLFARLYTSNLHTETLRNTLQHGESSTRVGYIHNGEQFRLLVLLFVYLCNKHFEPVLVCCGFFFKTQKLLGSCKVAAR